MKTVEGVNRPANGNRSRDDHSCSVDGLEDALEMDLPCNLLDKDRCQPLGTQFLVHTEVINLARNEYAMVGVGDQ